ADDDIDLAGFDLGQLLAQAFDCLDQIAREHQDAALGKDCRDLLLEPLDARAARDEGFGRLTFRARGRRRRLETALVTYEPTLEPVLDEPTVAGRALEAEPAGAAQGQRGVAAPIEKQERLVAACDRVADRLDQPWRDEVPARRPFAPQVDRID